MNGSSGQPIPPGATIGVIGGGQLGRMLILEGARMGYRWAVIDRDLEGPAAQVADAAFAPADFKEFAAACRVATYEFEHFDGDTVKRIEALVPTFPATSILDIKRNRVSEKTFLSGRGFPVPRFWTFADIRDVRPLIPHNLPLVVKTSTGGYDGKGLRILRNEQDYAAAEADLRGEIIAEELVPFTREISTICARNAHGDIAVYPIVENVHRDGILLYTVAPVRVGTGVRTRVVDIVTGLARELGLVGLLVVEMFLVDNDEVLINEFAPRPHNSGHYTIDACDISQFEMLIRTICNLPLETPRLISPAAMLNILGKGIQELDYNRLLSVPGAQLHLYGKRDTRGRRKMGHITVLDPSEDDLMRKLSFMERLVYG